MGSQIKPFTRGMMHIDEEELFPVRVLQKDVVVQ